MAADRHPSPTEEITEHERAHVVRETMAVGLYIAISLLASLGTLVDFGEGAESPLFKLWGILIGLLLSHWFAFRLAQIATDVGNSRRQDLRLTGAGLVGGLKVGVLITVVDLVFPADREASAVTIALLGYIAAAGAIVARAYGAGRLRTVVITAIITALGLAIVGVKNLLAGY